MSTSLSTKVAVVETRLDAQKEQVDEHDSRIHQLEEERATMRLATRELANMRRELPKLAEAAATRAVELVLETRAKRRRDVWAVRAAIAAAIATAAGAGVGIASIFFS